MWLGRIPELRVTVLCKHSATVKSRHKGTCNRSFQSVRCSTIICAAKSRIHLIIARDLLLPSGCMLLCNLSERLDVHRLFSLIESCL